MTKCHPVFIKLYSKKAQTLTIYQFTTLQQ